MEDLIDLAMLTTLDDATRRARLLRREAPVFMTRRHQIWDAAEDRYLTEIRPPETFDVILP